MLKIFIVEDEPSLRKLYRMIFENAGFTILGFACVGQKVVSDFKALSEKLDVILMDHRMPIKTGIEASKEILQIDKNVKIIFTSADINIKEEAISIGAFSFWDKSFMIDVLLDDIKKAFKCYDSCLSN